MLIACACAALGLGSGLLVAPGAAAATRGQAASGSGCAWASQIGAGGVNGYDADADAGYWITSFLAIQGTTVELSGSFPQARYMSISAYTGLQSGTGVHLYDAQINPATGSNPFQTGVAPGSTGTYNLYILAQAAPASPAANTLYVGDGGALIYVMYRVYDSSTSDPEGGAGLPQETITQGGTTTVLPGTVCSPGGSGNAPAGLGGVLGFAQGLVPNLLPAQQTTPPPPVWAAANVTHLPDEDTGYLGTQITEDPGEVVVFRAQMPSFPNTNAGAPPWQPAQVRYWSFCEYQEVLMQYAGCVADYAAVQSNGVATFVVSTPSDRPTNANPADGVNWLPWGGASLGLLVYRQILASPSFSQSIEAAAPGGSLQLGMGPYYPTIAYCSTAEFEAAGATGCLSPTPGTPGSGTGSSGSAGSGSGGGAGTAGAKLSRARIAAALDPEIAPTGRAARIRALLKDHGYTFGHYQLPAAGRVQLNWWYAYHAHHGRTLVATGSLSLAKKLTGKLREKLTSAGRHVLAHRTRAAMTGVVSYRPTGATAVTLTRAFTLSH